ncbi:MAG: hypothetical protein AVDCRST_MAG06-1161 [uncultured Nocardioides sp.]|uniref:Uncharacterized protein n=1 Tax=uncultured Nocardioides sp. TaxID=198441 RepID=A0A6J4NH00_9ACTN|nr:MAG: hypothetical protein AVDCRST_MAG06-1161 [uncultured Nocardioides sp.]
MAAGAARPQQYMHLGGTVLQETAWQVRPGRVVLRGDMIGR